jgi:hypothetical protein
MRRALLLGWLVGWLGGCQPPGATAAPRRAPPAQQFTLAELVGGWRWLHRTTAGGTTRTEDERWRFRPMPGVPTQLVGRYVRTVEVHSDDRRPFQCNQRPWYRQRAVFDVHVEITRAGFAIRETAYHSEPSPCDHGFRRTSSYAATLDGARLALRWEGGAQTLSRIDDELTALAPDPWPATPAVEGPWRWDLTSFDDEGNVHDESEWWQITRRTETQLDATYRRRVTVRSADGKPLACAGAPSWTFDDAYVLDARREDEHWHFYERARESGDHPCLRVTPGRNLDEATAEQLGDHLVLEWRGKRRQVLYRPE